MRVKRSDKLGVEKIELIFRLFHEVNLTVDQLHELFYEFRYNEIYGICEGIYYVNVTEDIKIDFVYSQKVKKGEIFPLSDTYVTGIYVCANRETHSRNLLSKIFRVSETTIKRIKLSQSNKQVISNIDMDLYYILDNIRKNKNLKPDNILDIDAELEIIELVKKVNDTTLTKTSICKMFNISMKYLDSIVERHHTEVESKYSKKLSTLEVLEIFDMANANVSTYRKIAEMYHINKRHVYMIRYGKYHRKLLEKYRYNKLIEIETLN
jgi:hypothetical protein